MLFIIAISSLWIVILRQFSFVHKKNVHRVYILIFHILESVNSLFFLNLWIKFCFIFIIIIIIIISIIIIIIITSDKCNR